MMGGHIGVESTEGHGSTFWFTAVLDIQPMDQQTRKAPPQDIQGKRVLVVDDHQTNREVLGGYLKHWNCKYAEATGGMEALAVMRQQVAAGRPFDLALIDHMMPEMDGLEAAEVIRDPASPVLDHAVPIIALTAHAMKKDRDRCLEASMDDILTKPIDPQQLLETLNRYLAQPDTDSR